jgi:hypothetical protein
MLKGVSRSRRRLARGTKPRRDDQVKGPAAPPGTAEQVARLPTAKVLERISQVRLQRDELDAELALLIDHAVSLGIGWPDIAQRLGVAARDIRRIDPALLLASSGISPGHSARSDGGSTSL